MSATAPRSQAAVRRRNLGEAAEVTGGYGGDVGDDLVGGHRSDGVKSVKGVRGLDRAEFKRWRGRSVLSSRDNRWLKEFRVALRGGVATASGAVGVEGVRLVEEALTSGCSVEAVLFSETGERQREDWRRSSGSGDGISGAADYRSFV